MNEPTVSPQTPMPKGYGFLKKGYPYLTALCRRKTHDANKTLYVVTRNTKPLGIRAPKWILAEVFAEERATREKRRDAVQKRDEATAGAFSLALRRLFCRIPEEDATMVVKRALKKRSGRVGRTGKLEVDEKVRLAVAAHVRHRHTAYDNLMVGNESREASRKAIAPVVARIMRDWGGEPMAQSTRSRHPRERSKSRQPTRNEGVAKTICTGQSSKTPNRQVKQAQDKTKVGTSLPATRGAARLGTAQRPIEIDLDDNDDSDNGGESHSDSEDDIWEISDFGETDSEEGDESDAMLIDDFDDMT